MEIKGLKEEILKRYGRYLFGIVDIDVWYDRVEIVSRVEIKKGGRISSHEGTIVVLCLLIGMWLILKNVKSVYQILK